MTVSLGPTPRRVIDRARGRRLAAVGVFGASWALGAATVVLGLARGHPLVMPGDLLLLVLLNALAWGMVGSLLLARRVGFVSLVLCAAALGSGVSALAFQFARAAGDRGVTGAAEGVAQALWIPGTLIAFSVAALRISARPASIVDRVVVVAGAAASLTAFIGSAVPKASEGLVTATSIAQVVLVSLAALTGGILVRRLVTWSRSDRRGLAWLVAGQWLMVCFVGPTLLAALPAVAGFYGDALVLAPAFAIAFMPAAVVVAALGQGLLAPEAEFNRRVVSALVVVTLVAAYVFLAVALAAVLPVPPTIAGVVVVVVLAIGFAPVQRRVERSVDAAVYGDAADPAELLRRLGGRLGEGAELDALVAGLLDTLRLGRLEIRSDEHEGVVAAAGSSNGLTVEVPLRSADQVVGRIIVTAAGSHGLDRRVIRVLDQIGGVLALAVQLAALNRELEETRDRALVVGQEERRMVRRELHVGLAPALAEASTQLDLARGMLGVDDAAAHRQLAAIRTELAARTEEVRDLARTLLPGALDAGDLDTALRDLAERFSRDGLRISVDSDGADLLDPARQAAIHHILAEAALLARRCAVPGNGMSTVSMRVTVDARIAIVVIGIDAPIAADEMRAALDSIDERARELGGDAEVTSGAAGHEIRVEVPR